jgi:protein-S-isoprenylcysteine O-methyltransferase Ste14
MKRTILRAWSLFWVLARVALLLSIFQQASGIIYVFCVSEFLAIATTTYALIRGRVDLSWRGAAVPALYCVPLLFSFQAPLYPDYVQPNQIFGAFYLLFAPVQWLVRIRLGFRCTIAAPVFLSLCDRFPYSIIRHPLAGLEILLCWFLVMWWPTPWNWCVFALVLVTGSAAVLAEEKFLAREQCYRDYCGRVKFRFIPGLW